MIAPGTPGEAAPPKPAGPTCSVVVAGRYYFGLGRSGSYEAAKDGTIPTIRVRGKLRAVVAKLDRLVAGD
jgi:hypothetical protein